MDELSARARRVLDLVKDADVPAPDVQQRVERALSARIAGGAGPSTALLGKSTSPLAAKALVPLGLAASVAGAGWFGLRSEPASPISAQPPSAILSSTQLAPRVSTPPPVESPRPVVTPTAPRPAVRKPAPRSVSPPTAAHAVDPSTPPTSQGARPARETPTPLTTFDAVDTTPAAPAAERTRDPLLAETAALKEAQHALRSGDTDHALQLLSDQDQAFAGGSLQQERAAARILALCQAGRAEQARALAARFVERWPRSALRARVTSACRAE
jgi:hypothetical protein